MGVSGSIELPKHFADITKWPKTRVESVVKAYNEGEYDFGVDHTVVMNITGYDIDDAKELVKAHAKNDSGIINAVVLLISIISLGNAENRNEVGRLESIFDLMDFSHNSQISMDELTILLMCIGSSFSFITRPHEEGVPAAPTAAPIDAAIIQYSKYIYESLSKKPTSFITKDEFVEWTKENLFGVGITSINDVLETLINENPSMKAGAGETKD